MATQACQIIDQVTATPVVNVELSDIVVNWGTNPPVAAASVWQIAHLGNSGKYYTVGWLVVPPVLLSHGPIL